LFNLILPGPQIIQDFFGIFNRNHLMKTRRFQIRSRNQETDLHLTRRFWDQGITQHRISTRVLLRDHVNAA